MTTLKLKKDKPPAPRSRTEPRRPVRGVAAPRKQRTLAEAQAERADRAAQQRRPAPDRAPRDEPAARRERPPARSKASPQGDRPAQHAPRGAAPVRSDPQRPGAPPIRREPTRDVVAAEREGDRLSKHITALGLASRREADDWIAAGWVRVDGKLAVLGQRIRPDARIDIDARARTEQAQRVTIVLNKPVGYVSGQAEDGYEPAVVLVRPENRWPEDRGISFHAGHLRHLAPAGRLDIDSVGLLVLTQDGRVAKALIGENSRVEKEYLVRVRRTLPGPVPPEDIARLEHGLELDGAPLKPAKVSWANEDQLRIVLREGRKRQIRRMCELVGLEVLGLKRVRIGSVVLGKLPPGQWRYLRSDESFI
jgi:23S rRNA pseudouridine2604 synthase